MKRYKKEFEEDSKKLRFDRMTPKPDERGYYWLVYKDEQGREFYPLAYSAKELGKVGDKLAKIVSAELK